MIKEVEIDDYQEILGNEAINQLKNKADKFSDKHIANVNSTFSGGGVAEILNQLVTLLNSLGIETGWRVLKGSPDFFQVTKKFHNALQGGEINMTDIKKDIYLKGNQWNSQMNHLEDHDLVIVHDPQPLPFVKYEPKEQPWIWRCHIDLTQPNSIIWNYLSGFVEEYDEVIMTSEDYKQSIETPQRIIKPSIDPLSTKNKDLDKETISKYLHKNDIERDKPIITQISRFDKWKDQLGVIDVYKEVKKEIDCKLVLMGEMAFDDPEAPEYYQKVVEKSKGDDDIILITQRNDLLVNILQRVSDVVLQKSIKEGFGLTISEAMWKGTPVIGTDISGIRDQIKDGETGFLVENKTECAGKIKKILGDNDLKEKLGRNARKHVKENFLITRQVRDYLDLFDDNL